MYAVLSVCRQLHLSAGFCNVIFGRNRICHERCIPAPSSPCFYVQFISLRSIRLRIRNLEPTRHQLLENTRQIISLRRSFNLIEIRLSITPQRILVL